MCYPKFQTIGKLRTLLIYKALVCRYFVFCMVLILCALLLVYTAVQEHASSNERILYDILLTIDTTRYNELLYLLIKLNYIRGHVFFCVRAMIIGIGFRRC